MGLQSNEENEILTAVGAGTLMGELLRRYWQPIAAVAELEDRPTKAVRLMGEDLVLYHDQSGRYGLLERHCPHRGTDLSYGIVEECGLRCPYHGWRFDETGQCREQPFEETVRPDARFRDRIKTTAYPVESKAGLLWAYLGPSPAPLVPDWEPLTIPNVFVQIVMVVVPCNWLQCQENSIDPVHFEWLHARYAQVQQGSGAASVLRDSVASLLTGGGVKHVKIDFEEFEYGFVFRRVLEGGNESHPLWREGRVCLWPNGFFPGRFEWRVPIDDVSTLSVLWTMARVPHEQEPYVQERIPYWYARLKDEATGRWLTSHNMNQDIMAWLGQGAVADRTREHLGECDRGVIMLRRKLLEQARVVAAGGEPKAVIRDPAQNRSIVLPWTGRRAFLDGYPRSRASTQREQEASFFEFPDQPAEVRDEYLRAMGVAGGRR